MGGAACYTHYVYGGAIHLCGLLNIPDNICTRNLCVIDHGGLQVQEENKLTVSIFTGYGLTGQ